MTVSPESNDVPPYEVSSLDELIAEFDNKDIELQMAYSRYLDRPTAKKMLMISDTTANLFDELGKVLQKVIYDTGDSIEIVDEKVKIVASLLHGMNIKHSELLIDYTDAIILPTEDELSHVYGHLCDSLQGAIEDSSSTFVDKALGHFQEVLDTDMEAVEYCAYEYADSLSRRIAEKALYAGMDIVKVSGGVIIGMFIFNKLQKK